MIKNIIFDFGAVLIPIDARRSWEALKELGAHDKLEKQHKNFQAYEKGKIDTREFIKRIQPHFFRKNIFPPDLEEAWCALLNTPLEDEVIKFLKKLRKEGYRLFLLSNTNELHIRKIRQEAGSFRYAQFARQFEKIYYSYEVGMRKPEKQLFKKLLKDNNLTADETFFVDDNLENVESAKKLDLHTWHFNPEENDIKEIREKLPSKQEV